MREDEAAPGYVPEPGERETPVERFIREGFDAVTPNGILGDARGATGELGEAMIAALADAVAARFAEDLPTDGPAASAGGEDRG